MIDKNIYKEIVYNIIKNSKGLVSDRELYSFREHIEHKLKFFEPTLMIYGTYNSGKSTLLNALFGIEEMAKTGDSPETDRVHEYNYNGYTIYDTPGINAPIEHEEVTNRHLKKCEVILFVLSNDGSFEEEYIYKKVIEIVKHNKPLLIVLNNKNGNSINSKETIEEINKININLSKIGDRDGVKNIEDRVSLVVVDALTALEGKVEKEQELIEESNILQLEATIDKLLKETGNSEVIQTLNIYINNFIDKILLKIDEKLKNPELKKTEELLTFLEKFKSKSEIELKNIIYKRMNILENGLREKFLNKSNEDEIYKYLKDFLDDLITQIELKLTNIFNELSLKIEKFSEDINAINLRYKKVEIKNNYEEENNSFIENGIVKTLKNKEFVTDVTKEALLKLRDYKILFKGKWERTLSRYAGRFATVVNVLVGAYEIYQAFKSHDEYVERQRQHVLSAKNKSEEIVDSLKNDFFNSVDEVLNSIFNNLIQDFKKVSLSLNEDHNELVLKKENLYSSKLS